MSTMQGKPVIPTVENEPITPIAEDKPAIQRDLSIAPDQLSEGLALLLVVTRGAPGADNKQQPKDGKKASGF